MTTTRSIADYAKQINLAGGRPQTAFSKQQCSVPKRTKSLRDDDKKALVKKLDFSPAAFSKLVRIGERKELQLIQLKRFSRQTTRSSTS